MNAPTLDELRKRYFVEVWQPHAFVNPTWRGCALDRDVGAYAYNSRMPRFLFEAIVAASGAQHLCVATDVGTTLHAEIPADWESYCEHMRDPDHYAIDYLIHDASGRWACLADFDVTHFGADRPLADQIDRILSDQGASLAGLTMEAFGDLSPDLHLTAVIGGES